MVYALFIMNISKSLVKKPIFHQVKCTGNFIFNKLYTTEIEEKIEIPQAIPRRPTDILRALENTISRDPTAAHYKYHDDPYLIPLSNVGKRTFAMAQEAGRKAAHWVRQENAHLFNHREADPMIEKFLPKMVYNGESNVSEDDLKNSIKDCQIEDSKLIYNLLKKQGKELSRETEDSLLELMCYFNSEDTLQEDFIEERWFKQSSMGKERNRKTWKDGNFAEEIFISIENPTARNYSALIQGMAKYFHVDRAWHLFEETQQKGLVLSTETYNSIIRVVNFLKEDFEMRWALVINLLTDMNKLGIKPDLRTLNSTLNSLSTMGNSKFTKDTALKVLKEFKNVGIEPSLGSWYYVLITFCKQRGPISTILHDIMREVENKPHDMRDTCDTNFFVTAMDICRNHLNNVELARRVDKLLHVENNYNLLGDSYKESIYYRHYFSLLVSQIPFDEFMTDVYNIFVPNIYVPEPTVMDEILRQVDVNSAIQHVPKLWSDMIIFDHHSRQNLVEALLDIMINNEPDETSELRERFAVIAWDMHLRIRDQNENKAKKLQVTGDNLGNIMTLLLRNNEFDKACTVMDILDKEQQLIIGVPKFESLSLFVDKCIETRSPTRAIMCIQYCSDCGFAESSILANRLKDNLTLDAGHISSLSKFIGTVDSQTHSEEKV